MRRIENDEDVAAGLVELTRIDPRLEPVVAIAGPVPLRRRPPGFEGLARIVVAQQVSAQAATSIWNRFEETLGGRVDAAAIAAHDDETLRGAGLSRPKVVTLRAISAAVSDGLDLEAVAGAPVDEATEKLVAIKGIGPWTAEVFLLFCAGHPDVWPGGDLALRNAVGDAFDLGDRPDEAACRAIAAAWAPWRGVAARLFWAYYAARRDGREGAPR
ncbi:DNA-3-methyladenine glycosylase family protein [Pinisolibacter sp.]|uniref:DNA-3-methyladenine glycosylase family protein n=1 Tax=Pinisolibacter sp. TaxID=2172024 RepID=UPI002FDD5399